MRTYAAIYNNNQIRENSSSGGMFSAIAEEFDVVYGVAMTEDCYGAEVVRIENDISLLRGSKYFQAKVGETFKQVKKDLLDGRKVLFSGTGCQINGLSMFLGKRYANLLLLDIICHGTPSPKLWREYVIYQEKKYGKLEDVNFRCKDNGRTDFSMKDNQLYISKGRDPFMHMFLCNYCLRPACYECHAKNCKKSDITIADFWGIEDVAPEMNDGRGTSLVIARTDKGEEFFDGIKDNLKWKEVSYEEGVRGNPSEYSSVVYPQQRDTFFQDLKEMTFEEIEKKYAADIKISPTRTIIRKFKHIIKKVIGCEDIKKESKNTDYGMLFTFKSSRKNRSFFVIF